MKKYFLAALLLVISNYAFGQFSIGLKAGGNLTDMRISTTGDERIGLRFDRQHRSQTSYHIGGYVAYQFLNDVLRLQAELLYSRKGARYDAGIFFGERLQALDYLTIPVIVSVHWRKFSIGTGLEWGHLEKSDINFIPFFENKLQEHDLGWIADASYAITPKIAVNARLIKGLSNISYTEFTSVVDGEDIPTLMVMKNMTYQLSLNYQLFRIESK